MLEKIHKMNTRKSHTTATSVASVSVTVQVLGISLFYCTSILLSVGRRLRGAFTIVVSCMISVTLSGISV